MLIEIKDYGKKHILVLIIAELFSIAEGIFLLKSFKLSLLCYTVLTKRAGIILFSNIIGIFIFKEKFNR